MPLYEYHCSKCEHKFEKLQKFSDSNPDKCPNCGEPKPDRLISAGTSFCLMGYGWDKPGMSVSSSRK